MTWKDDRLLHYVETKALLKPEKVEVFDSLGSIAFIALLAEPPLLMWEHQGKCQCGQRAFLFALCPRCLKEEALEKTAEEVE